MCSPALSTLTIACSRTHYSAWWSRTAQGDMDYETRDVTKGDVDITLTNVLPYVPWGPRPGLGVWRLFGAGWGDIKLRDEAGEVKTESGDVAGGGGGVAGSPDVATDRRRGEDGCVSDGIGGRFGRPVAKTAGDAQRLRLMLEGRTA